MDYKKILSVILISIGLIILSYTFYKSEIYFQGLNRKFYLIYYLVSLFFFFFAFLNLYISKKTRANFVIIFVSFILSFYCIEIFLNYYPIKSKSIAYKKKTGKIYDTRAKFEIYSDLRKVDNSIVIYNSVKNFDLQTFGGISNSKTLHCNENGYYSIYESDKYGFNNPKYDLENTNFEYVVIGDSLIHGACFNRPYDISSVLRNISKKNTLNLGIQDTGPLEQYAILKEYLPKKFNKLIWFYSHNDNEDLTREIKDKLLNNYLNDDNFTQQLKKKQLYIDKLLLENLNQEYLNKKTDKKKSYYINIIKLFKTRSILLNALMVPQNLPKMPKEFFLILEKVQKISIENDAEFYVVLLPSYSQVKFGNKNVNENFNIFKNQILQKKIKVIDIKELVFDAAVNPLKFYPFEKKGHLNKLGNKSVGKLVYKLTK